MSSERDNAAGWRMRVVDRLSDRLYGLPPSRNRYDVRLGLRVPMRDGIELLADHFSPHTEDPAAAVLIRSPYGRAFPINLTARAMAARGYHVVLQSVRGTSGSGDRFQPMVREADDGQDTVAWLREQSWFDGRLATYGGSYLGFAQWALLQKPPSELRASVIVVGPHDMAKAQYGTGAFALADWLGWSDAAAHQEHYRGVRRMRHMAGAERRLHDGMHKLPLAETAEAALAGRAPWYRDWLAHSELADEFWDGYRAEAALQKSKVPTLLVGGWQDGFLEQTMEQYQALRARKVDVALTVGPWTHMDTARNAKANGAITRETFEWLDQHLADSATSARPSPVRVFVTGTDDWRDYAAWPPSTEELAYQLDDRFRLAESKGVGTSSFRYDPADPTPSVGGRMLTPGAAGVEDNQKLEARSDVLTFTTATLLRGIEVLGAPVAELAVSVDNPYADLFVRVCDVDTGGKSQNVTDALLRLDPKAKAGATQKVSVVMAPCAHRIGAGHRLRLQVSGGAHPRFARNVGTGEAPDTATTLVASTFTIRHDESRLVLPVATS